MPAIFKIDLNQAPTHQVQASRFYICPVWELALLVLSSHGKILRLPTFQRPLDHKVPTNTIQAKHTL